IGIGGGVAIGVGDATDTVLAIVGIICFAVERIDLSDDPVESVECLCGNGLAGIFEGGCIVVGVVTYLIALPCVAGNLDDAAQLVINLLNRIGNGAGIVADLLASAIACSVQR